MDNKTPFCGFAAPRSCVTDLGMRFDESLSVCEDWEFLLRAAMWCGVADSETITALYRRWESSRSAHLHSGHVWNQTRDLVHASLDQRVLLLPPESASQLRVRLLQIRELLLQLNHYQVAAAAGREEIDRMTASRSWKLTRPVRAVNRWGRGGRRPT